MQLQKNNLSKDYQKGWEDGIKQYAKHILDYELESIRGIRELIRFLERTARVNNAEVPTPSEESY